MTEFNEALCTKTHVDMERRMTALEESWTHNLERFYLEITSIKDMMMKRLPAWVTVVISVLSAVCSGLIVAVVKL